MWEDISTNAFGTGLKVAYADLRDRVSKVYGKPDETDLLMPGSIWNEPEDWVMGLLKKDGLMVAKWVSKKKTPFKDNIASIYLSVNALSKNKGWLVLEYYFDDYEEAEATDKEEEEDAL